MAAKMKKRTFLKPTGGYRSKAAATSHASGSNPASTLAKLRWAKTPVNARTSGASKAGKARAQKLAPQTRKNVAKAGGLAKAVKRSS